jgi:hypothetical protein
MQDVRDALSLGWMMHSNAFEWLWSTLAARLGADDADALQAEFLRRQHVSSYAPQSKLSSDDTPSLSDLEQVIADTIIIDPQVAVLVAHRLLHDPELVDNAR